MMGRVIDMTKLEIAKKIAEIHNGLLGVSVSGNDTILMAQALVELRDMVNRLQKESEEQAAEE